MRKRSEKQVKSSKRSFMIMYITGVISTLKLFSNYYVRSYSLKGQLNVVILKLDSLLKYLKQEIVKEELEHLFYGTTKKM